MLVVSLGHVRQLLSYGSRGHVQLLRGISDALQICRPFTSAITNAHVRQLLSDGAAGHVHVLGGVIEGPGWSMMQICTLLCATRSF